MTLMEILKSFGLPEETINTYVEKGMIKQNKDNGYFIASGDLIITLITKCIACKIDPKGLIIPNTVDSVNEELEIIYTNILNRNFTMAADAAELIKEEVNTYQLELLISACREYEDINHYVLKNSEYGKDEATKKGLQKLERKLLLELELFDYSSAIETIGLIGEIYRDYNTEFPYITAGLLRIINEFSQDHLAVGNSSDEVYIGPSDYVLELLVESNDIYRADELIEQELQSDPYSIEWQIYFALMYEIKILNEKNLKIAVNRSVADASYDITNAFAFPETPYPRLTKEDLKKIDDGRDAEVDDIDYYTEYENALFEEGNFELAKEMLMKHEKQSALQYSDEVFDYLEDELDILIKNKNMGVDMQEYNIALKFAMNYMELGKFDLAKNYAAKCYNLLQIKNPRLLCMLGKIYYKTGDINRAEYFYDEAFKGTISPDDIEDMILVYYENKAYQKVINALGRYDYYMSNQNAKLHYIAASSYLKLKKYDDSRNELETCTLILDADDNLPIEFAEERRIIDEAEKGKDKTFGLDDYVDYEITDEEYLISQYLDENVDQAYKVLDGLETSTSTNYTQDLKYILSVTKILFQACDFDRALEFCEKIDNVFDTKLLSKEDAKTLSKMLNNLKRI